MVALFGAELNEVIVDQPNPTLLNRVEEEVLLYYLEHLGPHSPAHYFRIASLYIQTGELEEARKVLELALEENPGYLQGLTQLGFVDLWEKKWQEADEVFERAWRQAPCDPKVAMGLLRVALWWDKRGRAVEIAAQVGECKWEDPDVLLYLGILDTRLERWEEAERALQAAVEQSPRYRDAWFQLAHLYVLEEKYGEAAAIYDRYAGTLESEKGLADIAARKKKYAEAASYYRKALAQKPDDTEAIKGLAQALSAQLKYTEAKKEYESLLEKRTYKPTKLPFILPREEPENWIQLMDVRSHTDFALKAECDYTDALEDDPTLRVPTVKDYYFSEKFTLFIPIFDQWRVDAAQYFYRQKENDILTVSLNYSAFLNGPILSSHYFFAKDWKWDVILKGIWANGEQQAVYPFQSSALFEPGTILKYNGDWGLFVLDGHVEDQVIKNFALTISELLRIDVYQGEAGIHPPVYMRPNFQVGAGQDFYHDSISNWKQHQKALAEIDFFTRALRLSYLFEHGKFKKLTPNYFTYQKQIQHTLALKWIQDFYRKAQFEAMWEHIIQSNHNVVLPVGNLIFTGSTLYLIGNRFTGLLRYRFRDRFQAEIAGHYYTLTLPYIDWNLRGSLFWQF